MNFTGVPSSNDASHLVLVLMGVAGQTLRKFYRDGKLYVTISSSMLRSHLEFQKPALVQAMNQFLEKDELFVKDYDKVGFVKELILK